MKRKALGKGLDSLIPTTPVRKPAPVPAPPGARPSGEVQIDVDRIRPNRQQPRKAFDEATLEELAASIQVQGVLQPVVVRPAGDGQYELVAGERRWRAAQRAGLQKVPAVVREVPDEKLLELALIENLQREDLNPIEEAEGYRVLLDELKLTQQDVASRVGKQRTSVTNALRLLGLPRKVQEEIRSGRLGAGHGKAIAGLEGAGNQVSLAERAVREELSVRQVEAIVARSGVTGGTRSAKTTQRDPNVAAAEQTLQRAVGTKVRIVGSPKRGRVELEYYSPEELDRIYQLLVRAGGKGSPAR
jgi:ParB family chromosome partitioning protein